jgi:hypothetical protein
LTPVVSAGILTAVLASAGSAVLMSSRASSSYEKYLQFRAADSTVFAVRPALEAFDDAEQARTGSLLLWRAAAAIYIGQAIHATWSERRLAARLRESQDYGSPLRGRVSVFPDIRQDRIGVGVNIVW